MSAATSTQRQRITSGIADSFERQLRAGDIRCLRFHVRCDGQWRAVDAVLEDGRAVRFRVHADRLTVNLLWLMLNANTAQVSGIRRTPWSEGSLSREPTQSAPDFSKWGAPW